MEKELVSVIVPVYNTKDYLEECLDSIISQSYERLQIVVVDDGSTDGSCEICDSYAQKDKRIEVIHTENGGLVKARKKGIERARGDYVGFVDSDDFVDKNMYESLVNMIIETKADFVHTGYREVSENGISEIVNFKKTVYDLKEREDKKSFLETHMFDILGGNVISYSIWSKLFKRELITDCYSRVGNDQQFGEDAICLFNCIFNSNRVALFPIALYNYRLFEASMSHMNKKKHFIKQVRLCSDILKIVETNGYLDEDDSFIYSFLSSSLLPIIKKDEERLFGLNQYYVEIDSIDVEKKILVYGAGAVGQDVYEQLKREHRNIAAIVDKQVERIPYLNLDVIKPKDILEYEYDYILIAVLNEDMAEEIKAELMSFGMDKSKIIWSMPKRYY